MSVFVRHRYPCANQYQCSGCGHMGNRAKLATGRHQPVSRIQVNASAPVVSSCGHGPTPRQTGTPTLERHFQRPSTDGHRRLRQSHSRIGDCRPSPRRQPVVFSAIHPPIFFKTKPAVNTQGRFELSSGITPAVRNLVRADCHVRPPDCFVRALDRSERTTGWPC